MANRAFGRGSNVFGRAGDKKGRKYSVTDVKKFQPEELKIVALIRTVYESLTRENTFSNDIEEVVYPEVRKVKEELEAKTSEVVDYKQATKEYLIRQGKISRK